MDAKQRAHAASVLRPIVEAPGFTGNAPGGTSRWRKGEASEWFPVRPSVVVEVAFDHVTGRRFRHAAKLLRWGKEWRAERKGNEFLFDGAAYPLPNLVGEHQWRNAATAIGCAITTAPRRAQKNPDPNSLPR